MIGGWLAFDVAMAEGWRRRSISIGLLGAFAALWAGAELLLRVATEPAEFAFCRRILYLGVAGATVCWYWVGVEADRPRWFRNAPWRVAIAALPVALIHSLLYWGPDGLVVSLASPKTQHGPLYLTAAAVSWFLIAAGLVHFTRAALHLQHKNQARTWALVLGIVLPLALNVLYAIGMLSVDPAPAMLGPAALLIHFAVVDTGLALHLPLARGDIIEQLAVGVVVADIHDTVIDANESARELLGLEDPRTALAVDRFGHPRWCRERLGLEGWYRAHRAAGRASQGVRARFAVLSSARQDRSRRCGAARRGRGLEPGSLDRVFDPFFTTKVSGSGLGLSISFDLAQRLGGRIEANARDGGGAEFRLYLPRG